MGLIDPIREINRGKSLVVYLASTESQEQGLVAGTEDDNEPGDFYFHWFVVDPKFQSTQVAASLSKLDFSS